MLPFSLKALAPRTGFYYQNYDSRWNYDHGNAADHPAELLLTKGHYYRRSPRYQ